MEAEGRNGHLELRVDSRDPTRPSQAEGGEFSRLGWSRLNQPYSFPPALVGMVGDAELRSTAVGVRLLPVRRLVVARRIVDTHSPES